MIKSAHPCPEVETRAGSHRYRLKTTYAIAAYLAVIATVLGLGEFLYFAIAFPHRLTSAATTPLINRVRWYLAHAADYNVVFIGDSRTFCGVHPELLDPLLGTSSINLAEFADWFPTQLPMVQDIAASIPRGTTVVWSVGSQNFRRSTGIYRIYPVGIANGLRYLSWGVPTEGLVENILYFNPAMFFFNRRSNLRQGIMNFLDRPLDPGLSIVGSANAEGMAILRPPVGLAGLAPHDDAITGLVSSYSQDPDVARVNTMVDGSEVTSLTVFFRRGSYLRIELDPAYFRRKQREFGPILAAEAPGVEPAYWRLFEEMLRTFKENGVRLIVNEIEEAPFLYGSPERRDMFRQFMRDKVEKRVLEEGFAYTRVDFDRFADDDYFDWDHLNSIGASKFTPMLADQLRPYVVDSQ